MNETGEWDRCVGQAHGTGEWVGEWKQVSEDKCEGQLNGTGAWDRYVGQVSGTGECSGRAVTPSLHTTTHYMFIYTNFHDHVYSIHLFKLNRFSGKISMTFPFDLHPLFASPHSWSLRCFFPSFTSIPPSLPGAHLTLPARVGHLPLVSAARTGSAISRTLLRLGEQTRNAFTLIVSQEGRERVIASPQPQAHVLVASPRLPFREAPRQIVYSVVIVLFCLRGESCWSEL